MKNIEKESVLKNQDVEKRREEKIQPSDCGGKLKNAEKQATSLNLSESLCLKLMDLIEKVNEDEITPQSVDAACNAASQIHKILRLNFEMQRSGY